MKEDLLFLPSFLASFSLLPPLLFFYLLPCPELELTDNHHFCRRRSQISLSDHHQTGSALMIPKKKQESQNYTQPAKVHLR